MYATLWTAIAISIILLWWIIFATYSEDEKVISMKKDLITLEEEFIDGTGWFIDTDEEGLPEIVVNQDVFDEMPQVKTELTQEEIEENEPQSIEEIPSEINLEVSFYAQAPDGDWSLPWKEACEESSVIQAYYFVQWKELSKSKFKEEVLSIVDIQKESLWKYIDTSMSETAQFLEEKYDYKNYKIIDNPTVEEMKYELAQGHPIIAPFAWKKLWNSFFTNWWPRYHVLVIVWYNEDHFITNDVWTSRWENFAYSYDVIMDSMHDLIPLWEWNILNWEKRILVIR